MKWNKAACGKLKVHIWVKSAMQDSNLRTCLYFPGKREMKKNSSDYCWTFRRQAIFTYNYLVNKTLKEARIKVISSNKDNFNNIRYFTVLKPPTTHIFICLFHHQIVLPDGQGNYSVYYLHSRDEKAYSKTG